MRSRGFHYFWTGPGSQEKATFLFQPDPLLSAQYLEGYGRKILLEPEKRLMLAVLEDAITSFQNSISSRGHRGRTLSAEAEGWIFEESGDWLFSFESICDVLGFNPTYLRLGLLGWKERKLPRLRNRA